MKTIDVCYVAWPKDDARLEYLQRSLASFRQFVTAYRHKIEIHISAETLDVSTENFRATQEIANQYSAALHWRNMPPSLGGNQNDSLRWGAGDYKLFSQDDWGWHTPVDISPDCDLLDFENRVALIRYATFYTEFEHLWETNYFEEKSRILVNVKMDGPYPYGDQPHLRRANFATQKSPTGGAPVGFFDIGPPGCYTTPESNLSVHLRDNGWKIAAYNPKVVDHIGSLSSSLIRR